MPPETATPLEVSRGIVAALGTVAALAAAVLIVRDYLGLRRDGVNGPTTVTFAERIAVGAVFLAVQAAYVGTATMAMLAPPPIPPAVAESIAAAHTRAAVSASEYVTFAVAVSTFSSAAMLLGSLWQLATRPLLIAALRQQGGGLPRSEMLAVDAQETADRAQVTADVLRAAANEIERDDEGGRP